MIYVVVYEPSIDDDTRKRLELDMAMEFTRKQSLTKRLRTFDANFRTILSHSDQYAFRLSCMLVILFRSRGRHSYYRR